MPKPVKKARKKPTGTLPVPPKPRRPSDPMRAAQAILAEHMSRLERFVPGQRVRHVPSEELPEVSTETILKNVEAVERDPAAFETLMSAYMAKIGSKGGKIGGKRRLKTMTAEQRKEIATRAAKARWKKRRRNESSKSGSGTGRAG